MNFMCLIWSLFGALAIVYARNRCITPNNEHGRCVPLNTCQVFLDGFDKPTSQFQRFFDFSRCGVDYYNYNYYNPYVCCGSVAKFKWYRRILSKLVPKLSFSPIPKPTRIPKPMPLPIPSSTPLPMETTLSTHEKLGNQLEYRHRNLHLLPPVGECGYQVDVDRVFGGKETGIDEFPWMALLEYQSNSPNIRHWCSGIIINERYILTAAHCITGSDVNITRVRLGEYDTSTEEDCVFKNGDLDCADPPQDILVESIFTHANYVNAVGMRHDDIGLIRLAENIKYNDFVKPICLPINVPKSQPGDKLIVVGWGLTENGNYSEVKRKVILPVVDTQECSEIFRPLGGNVTDSQVCAGAVEGRDSCFGDSGGPLMSFFPKKSDFFVEGIVSYSSGCGHAGVPSVNTRVASYLDWILDRMEEF